MPLPGSRGPARVPVLLAGEDAAPTSGKQRVSLKEAPGFLLPRAVVSLPAGRKVSRMPPDLFARAPAHTPGGAHPSLNRAPGRRKLPRPPSCASHAPAAPSPGGYFNRETMARACIWTRVPAENARGRRGCAAGFFGSFSFDKHRGVLRPGGEGRAYFFICQKKSNKAEIATHKKI